MIASGSASDPATAADRPFEASRARLVGGHTIHGSPLDFRELCRRAVPEHARYIVLDLDRTVHRGVNLGERLGWEAVVYQGYGPERYDRVVSGRGPGRVAVDVSDPAAFLGYVVHGLRAWLPPGLHYLLWGKLSAKAGWLRRWSYRRFGLEPVETVQRVPQSVLFHQLAELPVGVAHDLARRVWRRHTASQVIDREDIAWLRARCPQARLIIASASPRSVVEVAADALGITDFLHSEIEETGGRSSAPPQLRWRPFRWAPWRIAPSSGLRINANKAKIENLQTHYPDIFDPRVTSVGITDTGYGEDHCWAEHFDYLVDVNSNSPFSPIVGAASPAREIHSARLLTVIERRSAPAAPPGVRFGGDALEARVGDLAAEVESLAARFAAEAQRLAPTRGRLEAEVRALTERADRWVSRFNAAAEDSRAAALAALRGALADKNASQRRLTRTLRPLAALACAMGDRRATARRRLEPTPAVRPRRA